MRARRSVWPWPVLLAVALIGGCSKRERPTPPCALSATGTSDAVITLHGQTTMKCISTKGLVTVQGPGVPGTVGWHHYQIAEASSSERARAILDEMFVSDATVGDTLVFEVVTPFAGTNCSPYAAATLSVPSAMNCVVEGAVGPVDVSFLSSALTVRESDSVSVSVQAHNGPFDIVVAKGSVYIEAAVPETGHCLARTGKGHIDLHLPASSSVTLIARSERGMVTVTGLVLSGRVDSTGFVGGTLGAGTDTVRLETQDGNIAVGPPELRGASRLARGLPERSLGGGRLVYDAWGVGPRAQHLRARPTSAATSRVFDPRENGTPLRRRRRT